MSEKGHAKNIAQFAEAVSILTSLGTVYDPSSPLVKLPALNTARSGSVSIQAATDDIEAAETAALNVRSTTFDPLGRLVTRIAAAAAANITDERFLADLATIVRKLQGRRAGKREDDPATPDVDESEDPGSVSEMSFDNRIQHFAELIALLKTNGSYTPNEPELKIPQLEFYLDELRVSNAAAVNAQTAARNQRDARNAYLYNDTDGLLTRVKLMKNYLKSILDADNPQYRQIMALKFREVR